MANEIGYLIHIDKETKEGYKYLVTQNYLIGNSVECNLKITETSILDKHCRINRVDNEVCISSLNSENPVFVNGEPVSEKGKALKHCDTIRITANHEFEWNTTDRKIFSRSLLPVKNEPLVQENTRYSDSALTCWKRVDRPFEEQVDIAQQNQEKNDLETVSEAPGTESVDASIPLESDRYPDECENKIKRLTNTPIKSRKSKNPVSPFALSNTFISESKSNTSKILHQNDNDEMEFERTTKNTPEDVFEDLIQHASSQTAFHSTPKVASKLKNKKNVRASSSSLLDNNFESNSSKLKSFNVTLEKNEKFEEQKSISQISNQNEEKKANSSSKKITFTPTKRTSEGFCESRRNTRGRTSLLRKTFEENSCDNENKSLTTPEKLTESNNVSENSFPVVSEIDTAADTNTEFKFLDESLKSGFTSVSDENVTCEGSFIDKYKICNVVRSAHDSKNSSVAKCVRNLSCISPPENNRSQEYMDSMSTTPQKNSPSVRESIAENYDVSLMSCDETSMDRSLTSARKRRSTGFTPFVGTPSNEYRVTRRMSTTPFSKSLLSRTSVDFESNAGQSRDSKYSFERRSTPFKAPAGKSSIRDSISCQPIPESVSFEELEASNHEQDSTNDSKFRFITTRRGRRYGDNIFAAKEKILEESELKSDDGSFEEENTEISVTNASAFSEMDELSLKDKTETETVKDPLELKSILTPLPKSLKLKEKSAKRVTFVLPNSPECTAIEENSTFSVDESFAMISTSKPNQDRERSLNSDNVTVEEELHVSSRLETDPSNTSFSELGDDSNMTYSIDENCDESSSNAITACSTKIQSSLNDLSGVEQIEPSPTKCSTIIDTSEQESSVKANTLSETSNLTSSIAESSNRSCLPEKESTEPRNEVGSLEEITEIAVNENIKNSSSTKISFSPAVHLSGVKSLSKTPEKLKLSSGDAETTAEIKSSLARKSAEVAKNIASFKSSRMCKSLNLNEIVTSKSETAPAEKAEIEESKITNEVDAENDIVDEKEIAAEIKSSLARKSTEISRNIASFKSSRMYKSLNLDEIATSKSETSPAEKVLMEESKTTDEVSENIVDAENEVTVDEEIATENASNAESISNEEMIEFDSTNEKNLQPPEIIITEATFVDENANNEPLELVNENQTEVNEPINVESSSTVQFEDIDDNFETSELEESVVDRDGTLSSESSTNDEEGSPVLTQIRRSALPKSHSAAKISLIDDKIQPEENKSLAAISTAENESEKQAELNSSSNTPSTNVPSESTSLQANNENNEATENVSQLSLDVMVSDFDSSKLSDVLSTEYMADADSSKNSNNLSICNDSQLSDFSSKDTSDLDSVKVNVDNSDSKISDLSVNNTNASSNSITENNPIELPPENQVSAEDVGDVNSMENNVNRKTEIIECLTPELEAPKNIDENRKDISIEEICDTNLANISQSTSSSQDMGIRIDASSALINDLHKKLESTPQLSCASQDEATPAETFNLIKFPESTNVSSIDFTSQSKCENFKKPESVFTTENIDDVLTPIKTDFRASSTPQSTLRRCRRSSRIHRCNPDKSYTSLHECSIISDNSVTHSETENANECENLQQVVTENSDSEPTTADETTNPTEELSNEGNISENQNVEFTSEKRKPNAASISPSPATTTSPFFSPSISSVVIESSDLHTKEIQQDDHSLEEQTVDNVHVDQSEIPDVGEVILETRKLSLIDESIVQSINISVPRLAIQIIDPDQPTSPTIGAVQEIKKRLRTRKMQPVTPVEETSKQGVVTRNRKKGQAPLWLGKHFHCYLCLNSSGNFYKCVRKTTAKQVERKLKDHDDKENVYSLPKVADKSKKTDLSGEPITTSVSSATEKKPKKPPRRFKNLENNAVDAPSQEVDKDAFSKRSCSIVLPLLDPGIIIKSPVKVDESGKILIEEDPPVTLKRKRATKADSSSKKQTEPSISRTRQKQIKTVTFGAEDEESEDVDKQTDEEIQVIKPKRNLRNQSKMTETEVTTRSRKTAIEAEKKLKINRNIKIQLKPVNENAVISEPETVEKKIKPKRGAATLKNSEDANKGTSEGKSVPQKRAKRAPENTDESIPKRRRGKIETNDGIPSKEAAEPENDEIVTELPKRTRRQVKTIDQEIPALPISNITRSTRATKTKPLENFAADDGLRSKRRIMDVDQSSALNDAEKSNKRTKISKNTDFVNPDNKAVEKKPAKKTIITKENSSASIRREEPIASSSKTIPSPRITRNNRKTIIVQEKTKPVTKKTGAIKDEKPSVSVSLSPVNVEASNNVKKSAAVKKVETKHTVVTRNKNLSKKNGRVSTTLKTSGKSTRVSRKPAILVAPSPPKVASETSNRRITRSRAK